MTLLDGLNLCARAYNELDESGVVGGWALDVLWAHGRTKPRTRVFRTGPFLVRISRESK